MISHACRILLPLLLTAGLAAEAAAATAPGATKEYVSARYKFRFAYPATGKIEERTVPARGGQPASFEVRLSLREEAFLGCVVEVQPQSLPDDGTGTPRNLAALLNGVNVPAARRDFQPLPNRAWR